MERLCACCYEQAWYAKLGGVVSIKFLMERLPLIWVLQNQLTFLKALLFVMMDLTGEVQTLSNVIRNHLSLGYLHELLYTIMSLSGV